MELRLREVSFTGFSLDSGVGRCSMVRAALPEIVEQSLRLWESQPYSAVYGITHLCTAQSGERRVRLLEIFKRLQP